MAKDRTRRGHHSHPRRPSPGPRRDAAAGVTAERLDADPRAEDWADALIDEEFDRVAADPEAPTADAAEQHRPVRPSDDEPLTGEIADRDDADPADVAEQARGTGPDEDEYR